MPNGVTLVLFLSGPVVLIGYVAAGLSHRWATRRGRTSSTATVAEALTTVAIAAGAWAAIRYTAPGRTTFTNASAIGFLSSQVLTAWSSLALWAGAAAVLGHLAPVTRRFRGGSAGVAGAFALLVVFLPITALAAIGSLVGASAMRRDLRSALLVSYGATVVAEWLFAVLNPPGPYGLVHGPETVLFVAVLAGALAARWALGDVGETDEAVEGQ